MTREAEFIAAINDHKGQLTALQALVTALLRAMSQEMQANALAEWDKETEAARTMFLALPAPDDVAGAFEKYVKLLNDLRIHSQG